VGQFEEAVRIAQVDETTHQRFGFAGAALVVAGAIAGFIASIALYRALCVRGDAEAPGAGILLIIASAVLVPVGSLGGLLVATRLNRRRNRALLRWKMLDGIAQEAVADGVSDVIPPTVDFGLDQSRTRDESSIEVSPVFSRRGERPPVKQSGQLKPM